MKKHKSVFFDLTLIQPEYEILADNLIFLRSKNSEENVILKKVQKTIDKSRSIEAINLMNIIEK